MARCDFCGVKGLPVKKIYGIGSEAFKACPDCFSKYEDKDWRAIYKALISAGFYGDTYSLYDRLKEEEDKKQQEIEKLRESIASYEEFRTGRLAGKCPKCGGDVLKMDPAEFATYEGGLPTLNLSAWNTSSVELELHVCETCGYTEMYQHTIPQRHEGYLQNREKLEELLKEDDE